MRIRAGAATDVGRARSENEDAYVARDPLFAVADGMGGHAAGEVAASVAIETLSELDLSDTPGDPLPALIDEIREANRRVFARSMSEPETRGMGTTLTALVAMGDHAYLAHVGDSRAYLARDGHLRQLTEDHTLVQRWVRSGMLTPGQAEVHPQRNVITRSLGVDHDLTVDELALTVAPGDRILLCSDGLTGMVGEEGILQILSSEPDPQAACERLVAAANDAGGEDNVTVLVIDVEPDEADGPVPLAAPAAEEAEASATSEPPEASEPTPGPTPQAEAGKKARRRLSSWLPWRRVLLWGAVLLIVVAAAGLGVRAYADRQWYVGDAGGRVAIYNGIPTAAFGFRLSHVVEVTEVCAADAERFVQWRSLSEGRTADSLEDAHAIVAQIRRDVARQIDPSPTGCV